MNPTPLQHLISELKRHDEAATKGPWEVEGSSETQLGLVHPYTIEEERASEAGFKGEHAVLPGSSYLERCDADALAFLRNHCGKLAEIGAETIKFLEWLQHQDCRDCTVGNIKTAAANHLKRLNTIATRP